MKIWRAFEQITLRLVEHETYYFFFLNSHSNLLLSYLMPKPLYDAPKAQN